MVWPNVMPLSRLEVRSCSFLASFEKGIITRIIFILGPVCQIGTRFKKSVNCIPTLEKVFQLGSFQTELTDVVSQRATCQSVVFFNFFLIFEKKIKMPRVKSLCVTRGIVSVTWHCNVTC